MQQNNPIASIEPLPTYIETERTSPIVLESQAIYPTTALHPMTEESVPLSVTEIHTVSYPMVECSTSKVHTSSPTPSLYDKILRTIGFTSATLPSDENQSSIDKDDNAQTQQSMDDTTLTSPPNEVQPIVDQPITTSNEDHSYHVNSFVREDEFDRSRYHDDYTCLQICCCCFCCMDICWYLMLCLACEDCITDY